MWERERERGHGWGHCYVGVADYALQAENDSVGGTGVLLFLVRTVCRNERTESVGGGGRGHCQAPLFGRTIRSNV